MYGYSNLNNFTITRTENRSGWSLWAMHIFNTGTKYCKFRRASWNSEPPIDACFRIFDARIFLYKERQTKKADLLFPNLLLSYIWKKVFANFVNPTETFSGRHDIWNYWRSPFFAVLLSVKPSQNDHVCRISSF